MSDAHVWFVRFALDGGGRTLACGNRAGAVLVWDPHELRARPRAKLKRPPGPKSTVRALPPCHSGITTTHPGQLAGLSDCRVLDLLYAFIWLYNTIPSLGARTSYARARAAQAPPGPQEHRARPATRCCPAHPCRPLVACQWLCSSAFRIVEVGDTPHRSCAPARAPSSSAPGAPRALCTPCLCRYEVWPGCYPHTAGVRVKDSPGKLPARVCALCAWDMGLWWLLDRHAHGEPACLVF